MLVASQITAVDFSEVVVDRLKTKYNDVDIFQLDISKYDKRFIAKFDVVNAIGIMFHIVDDVSWESAVKNISEYLKPDGVAIIGGEFSDTTARISHHRRVRSTDYWSDVLKRYNCKIEGIERFEWFSGSTNNGIRDNLLMFSRKR